MKKSRAIEIMFIGFALFASYFGAGNVMFPPLEGLASGDKWLSSITGLATSGIILPILALIVIGLRGSVTSITNHVSKNFYTLIVGAIMLVVIFSANPRTGALAVEMGVLGSFPDLPYAPFVIAYFVIVYLFSRNKGKALDHVGKILTPILVTTLLILIVIGILKPIGTPIDTGLENPFVHAFLTGYNTGDVLGSFLFATVFLATVEAKGFLGKDRTKVMTIAGIIAFFGLLIVYGGLLYIGACGSAVFPQDTGRAELLVGAINLLGGRVALFCLGIAIIMACMTTAVTQATAAADFFEEVTKGRLPYQTTLVVINILSAVVALIGVDRIVVFSNPLYNTIYPVLLALIVLAILYKIVPNDGGWKGGICLTLIYAILEAIHLAGAQIEFIDTFVGMVPLSANGFGWVCPCVIGTVVGSLVYPVFVKKELA